MEEISIKIDEEKSIFDIIIENKDIVFSAMFYIVGLIIGTMFFSKLQNTFLLDIMKKAFTTQSSVFSTIFINRFCLYFSVFAITVVLGMCLIGFPFLNITPLLIGLEAGLKISYFYVNHSTKGIGFALLMIIPECSAFVTIIIYTIKCSLSLSKNIYSLATKKTDIAQEINLKLYLKSFAVYSLAVATVALVNTVFYYFLGSIISI